MATANIAVPSLSSAGFVQSTVEKCDLLLSHFFLSEYSQSQLHYGQVSSLPWLIHKYQNNMSGLTQGTRQTLETYFGRYFPKAEVEVVYDDLQDTTTVVTLKIFIQVTDYQGQVFAVANLVEVIDSKINKIVRLNNTGE